MAMISGILSSCGNHAAEDSQAPTESVQQDDNQGEETVKIDDEEIQKAVDFGIVTPDYAAELDTQVTYAEFAAMLDAVTSAAAPERQAAWEDLSQALRDGDEPMNRGAGAVALFDCAMALEIDAEGYYMSAFWLEETMPDGMDYWDGMPWDDPHLPNVADAYVTDAFEGTDASYLTDYPIYNNAGWFVRRYSYGNGKCYMDYDENSSFR